MNRQLIYLRTENVLILALGLGIFLSKPVIYIATGLLTLSFLVRLVNDRGYRHDAFSNKLVIFALVIYVFGLLACLLMPTTWQDLSLIARKSLYLVIFAPLLLAFRNPTNRGVAMAGLLIGFFIASIATATLSTFNPSTGRLPGYTWLVDVWGVLCSLFLVFITPFAFDSRWHRYWRIFFAITALFSLALLVLSGARGPWLGAAVGLFAYFLFYQRKLLGLIIVATAISYLPAKQIFPERLNQIETRVASIAETKANKSNWIRLTLWQLALDFDHEKLKENPAVLLLGSGGESHYSEILDFVDRTDSLTPEEKTKLASLGYPSNDMHNMYLDSTAKHGLVWTLANLIFLSTVAWVAWSRRVPPTQTSLAAPAVVLCFLIMGLTYDLLPHFATTFLIFFATLACASNETISPESRHA